MSSSRIEVGLITETKTVLIGIEDKKIDEMRAQGGGLVFPFDAIQTMCESIKSGLSRQSWEKVVIVRDSEFEDFVEAQGNDLKEMRRLVKEWIKTEEGVFYKKEIEDLLISDVLEAFKNPEYHEFESRFKSKLWKKFRAKNGNILGKMLRSFRNFLEENSTENIKNPELCTNALVEMFYNFIEEKDPDLVKPRH